jgi:hypothetical protein
MEERGSQEAQKGMTEHRLVLAPHFLELFKWWGWRHWVRDLNWTYTGDAGVKLEDRWKYRLRRVQEPQGILKAR